MIKYALIIALAGVHTFAAEAVHTVAHVTNFAVVNDRLFRGAEPSSLALTELKEAGVKLVIDLRESSAATQSEKDQAEKLGMQYANFPFQPLSSPTQTQVQTVLNLLAQNQEQTVFIHCRRGKDRTGTVIACYRIQHDGWDNNHALNEARHFGMSPVELGMKSFILHFTPTLSPSDAAALSR